MVFVWCGVLGGWCWGLGKRWMGDGGGWVCVCVGGGGSGVIEDVVGGWGRSGGRWKVWGEAYFDLLRDARRGHSEYYGALYRGMGVIKTAKLHYITFE